MRTMDVMSSIADGLRALGASAALALVPAVLVGQQSGEGLSLQEAIERALQHSPQMAQAEGAVESAGWGERRAGAAFIPNVSMSSGAGLSGRNGVGTEFESPISSTRESYSAGVSASVDLFTGGRRGAEVDRSRAESNAASATLTERQYVVVLSAQRSFYEVARAAELVAVAHARVETAQQSLAAAERRMQVGSATSSDVLRAELEMSRARQSLLEAENQERNASLTLGRLTGSETPVGVRLSESDRTARPLSYPHDDVVQIIVEESPSVAVASASLRAAEAATRSAASQYLPRLQLSSGYDWSSQEAAWSAGNTGWNVRLGLSIPIFDGFQREASVADARTRANTAALQLADARRAAQADAERLVGAVRLSEQRIVLAEEGVRVAEEDLRVQQTRYGLGASTMLDQIASQTALVEARQNLVAARYDYQIARAELEALAGRPL
jgi:outer membrane protein